MKLKKGGKGGIEAIKRRYGYMFVAPWIFGVFVFVIYPMFTSCYFAFTNIVIGAKGVETSFSGFKHIKFLLSEDPKYINQIVESFTKLFTAIPIIIALSLILALILNQKFKGRLLARAVFFLPVIIGSSVVMGVLNGTNISQNLMSAFGGSDAPTAAYMEVINFSDLLAQLKLPGPANQLIAGYLSNTFNLIWSCGIQILLFVAGLQTIPEQLYEAGDIEGITSWEQFWFITIPMLGRVIMLVLFYTMVEQFIEKSALMERAMGLIRRQTYDQASAVLWPYFALVGIVVGLVIFLYHWFCLRKWE